MIAKPLLALVLRPPRARDRRRAAAARAARPAARQRHRPAGLARHRAAVRPARHPGGDPGRDRARACWAPSASRSTARGARSRSSSPARATARCGCARRGSPRPTSPAPATAARAAARRPACTVTSQDRQATRPPPHRRGDRDRPPGRPRRAGHFRAQRRRAGPRPRRASGPTGTSNARQGYLVEPDFTAKSPIPISTRGWVAWYTAATRLALARQRRRERRALEHVDGVGLRGRAVPPERRRRPGALDARPDRRPGRPRHLRRRRLRDRLLGRRAPDHQWQYVNAGTTGAVAAGARTHYCVYP